MARACSTLTASGFSIITGIFRAPQASTTARWPAVLVKATTACGFARSSIASSEGWTEAGSSRDRWMYRAATSRSGSAMPTSSISLESR